jgi:hypothetical protein
MKKISCFALLCFLLSCCVHNKDGELKRSANSKIFDTKGFHRSKRLPIYNKKYIDRAKYNILSGDYQWSEEDKDSPMLEQDEMFSYPNYNIEVYTTMLKKDRKLYEKKLAKANKSKKRKASNLKKEHHGGCRCLSCDANDGSKKLQHKGKKNNTKAQNLNKTLMGKDIKCEDYPGLGRDKLQDAIYKNIGSNRHNASTKVDSSKKKRSNAAQNNKKRVLKPHKAKLSEDCEKNYSGVPPKDLQDAIYKRNALKNIGVNKAKHNTLQNNNPKKHMPQTHKAKLLEDCEKNYSGVAPKNLQDTIYKRKMLNGNLK